MIACSVIDILYLYHDIISSISSYLYQDIMKKTWVRYRLTDTWTDMDGYTFLCALLRVGWLAEEQECPRLSCETAIEYVSYHNACLQFLYCISVWRNHSELQTDMHSDAVLVSINNVILTYCFYWWNILMQYVLLNWLIIYCNFIEINFHILVFRLYIYKVMQTFVVILMIINSVSGHIIKNEINASSRENKRLISIIIFMGNLKMSVWFIWSKLISLLWPSVEHP